jgi:hypothetical protein
MAVYLVEWMYSGRGFDSRRVHQKRTDVEFSCFSKLIMKIENHFIKDEDKKIIKGVSIFLMGPTWFRQGK